MFSRLSRLV